MQELQSSCRDHFITLHVCHSQVTKEKNGIISLQVRDLMRCYHITCDYMTHCLFLSLNVFPRNTAKDPFESVESKYSLSGITVCYKETQNDKCLSRIYMIRTPRNSYK